MREQHHEDGAATDGSPAPNAADALANGMSSMARGIMTSDKARKSLLQSLKYLKIEDIKTFWDLVDDKVTHKPWDDRNYLQERIVKLAAELPTDSDLSDKVTKAFVTALWQDLDHPPQSYLGSEYEYRAADGSNNNFKVASLGAANTPYARTCIPQTVQPASLPDPGLVFDKIMKRTGDGVPHENGISSFLFYLATVIIHDLFRTSHQDPAISKTTSYLDLSPLYGSTYDEQKLMRTFREGRLKPDCFSEKRVLAFPPGVSALLIMFNRYHNHVAANLALINEGGRFTLPSDRRDDALFQTARQVTCGLYINCILIDYVRTILNLNRTPSDWALDPRIEIEKGPPRGVGNQVSAEFNLIYRWHATVSPRDSKWIEDTYKKRFGGRNPGTMPMVQLMTELNKMERKIPEDPVERPIDDMRRNDDYKINDDDLVKVLVESIEDRANAFGAKQVPDVLRAVEVLGVIQARKWGMATLNELRKHFNLKEYETFEEINPEIADELRELYETPDHVEMYPGVVCEASKRSEVPGSGLMPGYTISRAILSDAVALVRGDRFYTIDYHPKALTNWGFHAARSNPAIDHGCVFYKLFRTALPRHFGMTSIYAHYPLTTPKINLEIRTALGEKAEYAWDRPGQLRLAPQVARSGPTVKRILQDRKTFSLVSVAGLQDHKASEPDFQATWSNADPERFWEALLPQGVSSEWSSAVSAFYNRELRELFNNKSRGAVDIVLDVGNVAAANFIAEFLGLRASSSANEHDPLKSSELYFALSAISCMKSGHRGRLELWKHNEKAIRWIINLVTENIRKITHPNILTGAFNAVFHPERNTSLRMFGENAVKRLLASGQNENDSARHVISAAADIMVTHAATFAQVLEGFHKDKKGQEQWKPFVTRSLQETTPANDKLDFEVILEMSRMTSTATAIRYVAAEVTVPELGKSIPVGTRLFLEVGSACRDDSLFKIPSAFIQATYLDFRPLDNYLQLGPLVQRDTTMTAVTAMLRAAATLPNLRPVPGGQGSLAKVSFSRESNERISYLLKTETGTCYFPYPTSMRYEFGAQIMPRAEEASGQETAYPSPQGTKDVGASVDAVKASDNAASARKRGRPSKAAGESHESQGTNEVSVEADDTITLGKGTAKTTISNGSIRKRGRPSKADIAAGKSASASEEVDGAAAVDDDAEDADADAQAGPADGRANAAATAGSSGSVRKRGRPKGTGSTRGRKKQKT